MGTFCPVTAPEKDPVQCQARPTIAQHRGDGGSCARFARDVVSFSGTSLPVCRVHAKKYASWGAQAESQARALWGWPGVSGGPEQDDDAVGADSLSV
jgi:hypothetical protein